MRYVCDAPGGKTWFRLETEVEAADESRPKATRWPRGCSHPADARTDGSSPSSSASQTAIPTPSMEKQSGCSANILALSSKDHAAIPILATCSNNLRPVGLAQRAS